MKIVTIVRTLNEQRNIKRFIKQYGFSDLIIISDGSSTDKTLRWAKQEARQGGVELIILPDFPLKEQMTDGRYFTNEPVQINQLIRKAKEQDADWIIYDDCDCFPNFELHNNARALFNVASDENKNTMFAYRLYVYKRRWYFPELNEPGKSLWAWNPKMMDVKCEEQNPREANLRVPDHHRQYDIEPPYVLMHDFAPNEREIKRKMDWYLAKGQPQIHPKDSGGKLVRLPEYAHI